MPPVPEDEKDEAPVKALDEDDIALLKTYGLGPYAQRIKDVEAGALGCASLLVSNACIATHLPADCLSEEHETASQIIRVSCLNRRCATQA